jgi:hypothetical protein
MNELIEGNLLFSSYFSANVYKITKINGKSEEEKICELTLCSNRSVYIAIAYRIDYDEGINRGSDRFSWIRKICQDAYGGRFPGSSWIAPVDFCLFRPKPIGGSTSDQRGIFLLIYPPYRSYDLVPIHTVMKRENIVRIMNTLIVQLKLLHEQGMAAGGFRREDILYDRNSGQIRLMMGPNALSGITEPGGYEKYKRASQISLEAKGFRRYKYLGLPRNSFWEQLEMGRYARCADLYAVMTLGFISLIGYHPLQGALCDGMDADMVRQEIFQMHPVFIFSPDNKENAFGMWEEEKAAIMRWNELPEQLRQLYQGLYAFPDLNSEDAKREVDHAAYMDPDQWQKAWKELDQNVGEQK